LPPFACYSLIGLIIDDFSFFLMFLFQKRDFSYLFFC